MNETISKNNPKRFQGKGDYPNDVMISLSSLSTSNRKLGSPHDNGHGIIILEKPKTPELLMQGDIKDDPLLKEIFRVLS